MLFMLLSVLYLVSVSQRQAEEKNNMGCQMMINLLIYFNCMFKVLF